MSGGQKKRGPKIGSKAGKDKAKRKKGVYKRKSLSIADKQLIVDFRDKGWGPTRIQDVHFPGRPVNSITSVYNPTKTS